ncbi:MAG: hypothetical protein AAB316_06680 [Bacteroidota bacterium]
MKRLHTLLFLLATTSAFSQTKPDFFPEDITSEGIEVRCFCKPGVRYKSPTKGIHLSYVFMNGGTLEPEDGNFTEPYSDIQFIHYLELDMKAPLISKDGFNLLMGYQFSSKYYQFDQVGVDFPETFQELNNHNLKSNSISTYLTKALNETSYLAFRLRYSSNGNYNGLVNFRDRYAIYRLLGVYARKPHDDLEWGIGVTASNSFRKFNALPFVIFNKTFNEHWGIESALPGFIFLRRNFNEANISLVGVEYLSQSYRFDVITPVDDHLAYAFNHSEGVASASLQHQFSSWIWGNLKAGYQLNFSTDFESKLPGTEAFKVEPADGVFFNLSLFLSPPEDFLHK